jgi:hypothetical protein
MHRGLQKPREPLRGRLDREPRAQVRLLGGDPDRTVVGVARAHRDAPDRLQGGIAERDAVGAEGYRRGDVGGRRSRSSVRRRGR